jgi:hypothetical protein
MVWVYFGWPLWLWFVISGLMIAFEPAGVRRRHEAGSF